MAGLAMTLHRGQVLRSAHVSPARRDGFRPWQQIEQCQPGPLFVMPMFSPSFALRRPDARRGEPDALLRASNLAIRNCANISPIVTHRAEFDQLFISNPATFGVIRLKFP